MAREVRQEQEARKRAAEETRRAGERARQEQEAKRREEEELQRRRRAAENERWGTPELAQKTWEFRARKLLDLINQCRDSFVAEAERERQRYSGKAFRIYTKNTFLPALFGEKKVIGEIPLREFSYQDTGSHQLGREYSIFWNGHKVINGYIEGTEYRFENPKGLEDVLRKVFEPAIAAERITREDPSLLREVKAFFEYADVLRQTSPDKYSFRCDYPHDPRVTEDDCTSITVGSVTVTILNPLDVRKRLLDFMLTMQKYFFIPSDRYSPTP